MTPSEFIRRYGLAEQRERQGSQSHFIDLCALLGVQPPLEEDPSGSWYCFERGATKTEGGDGWADVWRRGCFGWEYKAPRKNLSAALKQLVDYAAELESPPLLVVSDMVRIEVHTRFTGTVPQKHEWLLDDLYDAEKRKRLANVWLDPQSFRPSITPQDLTAAAARKFGRLGRRLQERPGADPRAIAHFLNQLVFCMFAEDAGLLPEDLFTRTLKATQNRPAAAQAQMRELFTKMATPAEAERFFGAELIAWFNGGLFDGAEPLELSTADLKEIAETAGDNDWSQIDPAIFGNLFEQALKATRERPALGAHYTDRDKIMRIVGPVIVEPLQAEWAKTYAEIEAAAAEMAAAEEQRKQVWEDAAHTMAARGTREGESQRRAAASGAIRARDAAAARAEDHLEAFLERLAAFRVLDPACGSGNFLYVALRALKDLEQRALEDCQRLGLATPPPRVGLACVRGIEIDGYAAELARVTLWIGDLQWDHAHGYSPNRSPVLSSLDQIENRDALLDPNGAPATWPLADVIVGNPPFVGGKKLRQTLGDAAVDRLFAAYEGKVPREADLVSYWVAKAWTAVAPGSSAQDEPQRVARAGLVTTNSIRGGANRRVIAPIAEAGALMDAWSDEPWVLEGAAVRVSMLNFGSGFVERRLNGKPVSRINGDLTSAGANLTLARPLKENAGVAFQGPVLIGPFQISAEQARYWLTLPANPNGRSNGDVLRPIRNAVELMRRVEDRWVLDFADMSESEASLYERPFEYALLHIQPERSRNRRQWRAEQWWKHGERGEGWRRGVSGKARYIVTPRVAKHRVFTWLPLIVFPDSRLFAFTRDDDTTFGILHSRAHELWSLATASWHGVGNDATYNARSCFETFPFPEGLTPNVPASNYANDPKAQTIAEAAADLNQLRERWLNPADLVRVEPEVVPGYPDRTLGKGEAAARELKTRTLTNLYNQRPTWLQAAHRRLDEAVAAAYGWPVDLPDEQVLSRLFNLNQRRSA